MRSRRVTWTASGVGLIACGVLGMLRESLLGTPGLLVLSLVTDLLWAGAVLLFAIGLGREGSVVRRRPLGVTALGVVAAWPLVATVTEWIVWAGRDPAAPVLMLFGYTAIVLPAAAGLVATVQIARARVVPHPWRWAPLAALGVGALAWGLPQLLMVAVGPAEAQHLAGFFSALGRLGFLAGTLGLGILALVLAARERPEAVPVFPSAAP